MRKVVLMLLLAVVSSSAIAEGTYQLYECKTENDMNSCSNSCKKNTVSVEFKVNPLNSTVLAIYFQSGGQKPIALEHCKVVDADNWVCSSTEYFGRDRSGVMLSSTDEQRLSGGIFASSIIYKNDEGISTTSLYSLFCAKKKSLFGIFD